MKTPPLEPSKYHCSCGNLAEWFVIVVKGNAFDKGLDLDQYGQVKSIDRFAACDEHVLTVLYEMTRRYADDSITITIRRENRQYDSPATLEAS